MKKRVLSLVLAGVLATSCILVGNSIVEANEIGDVGVVENQSIKEERKIPKYVFLFIGDGNALPQIAATENFLGALNSDEPEAEKLSFTQFPSQGMTTTYSTNSFITDSAAAGTAIATGNKTNSGMISVNTEGEELRTIAEMAKENGKKIGIVTTTTINHATPAVFYSHNNSRNNYYDIGMDLVESGFDYFGGGSVKKHDKGDEDVYNAAKKAGYKVVNTVEEFNKLTSKDEKILASSETLHGGAIPYSIDQDEEENVISLADFTRKGIEVLDNENGFFMMVEGGKIDWACHANDAATSMYDTIGFDDAVKEAIKFYNEHPEDTLILVTADHETGGLTLGFAGTGYTNAYEILKHQKVSYDAFDDVVKEYAEKHGRNARFMDFMSIITDNFGLKIKGNEDDKMVLTDYEVSRLKIAFKNSMRPKEEKYSSESTELLYGSYDPLTVTITHILNQKAGLAWTSYSHTGVPIPTYSKGIGCEEFNGYYDNTDLFLKLSQIMGIEER